MEGGKDELPEKLMKWTTEEMQLQNLFGHQLTPSLEDFKRLCKPPLTHVWTFVMNQVKAADNVKTIKRNISIHNQLKLKAALDSGKSLEGKRDDSVDKSALSLANFVRAKDRLLSEVASVGSQVEALQQEQSSVKADLQQADQEYQAAVEAVRESQRKACLARVVAGAGEEAVGRYREYSQRVKDRADAAKRRRLNQGFIANSKGNESDEETVYFRDVRLACEAIEDFLKKSMDENLIDKEELEASKLSVREHVEAISVSHPAGAVVEALTALTLDQAGQTREMTSRLDIRQDVSDLSFSLGPGGLQDLSRPPSVGQTLRQLLEESNLQHVLRWFEEQERRNACWKLEARLDNLKSELTSCLEKAFPGNPEALNLAKNCVNALITRAIEASVPPCLREAQADLQRRMAEARTQREELRGKHDRIQNFRALVDKKQSVIESLAKQNSGAPARLAQSKAQVQAIISSYEPSTQSGKVSAASRDLQGSLSRELERVASLPLTCLLTVPLHRDSCGSTRVCVWDLSLAPSICPAPAPMAPLTQALTQVLGYPAFKNVDGLMSHVAQLQRDLHCHEVQQDLRSRAVRCAQAEAGTDDDVDAIIALCARVSSHTAQQTAGLLPVLERSLGRAGAGLEAAGRAQAQADQWWQLPGVSCAGWLEVEGVTLEGWRGRWRRAVAQVHRTTLTTPHKS